MIDTCECKIKDIALKYKKDLSICMKNDNFNNEDLMLFDSAHEVQKRFININNDKLAEEKREILRINFVLSSMDRKRAMIIWNEYFFPVEKFWWMRDYTRSTFYRIRKKAIEEFLCIY